jgi:nifR3 family TIM-barrel protein
MVKKGFWKKLHRPIMALAPMADVTDAAFRRMVAKYGKPDVIFTEFISCEGLCSSGRKKLVRDLKFVSAERPIVAQLWGVTPKYFYECAKLMAKLGFDGIDINMGCPDKNVEKMGGGAKLILNPRLALEIIKETKRGAGKLPVSVKTRIGYGEIITKKWVTTLLKAEPAAITLHLRTRKEMSDVPAHWDEIKIAAILAKKYSKGKSRTLILGNGDVRSLTEAKEKVKMYGIDGVMVGRGIFGNPWFFNEKRIGKAATPKERIKVMLEHTILYDKIFRPSSSKHSGWKHFDSMKKHYKAYLSGFPDAGKLRAKMMETKNIEEAKKAIKKLKA